MSADRLRLPARFTDWPSADLDPSRIGEIWRAALRNTKTSEAFQHYLSFFGMPFAFGQADDNAFPDDVDREFYLEGAGDA